MRKNLENRLIAVVWVAFFGLAGCTIMEAKDDDAGPGGPSTTGSAGSGTAGTSAGSGGTITATAGSGGQGGSTGGNAGGAVTLADASLPMYTDASYSDAGCTDDSDAGDMPNPDSCSTLNGANGGPACYDMSPGKGLCDFMQQNARPGAFQVFVDCIKSQTKNDACANVDICVDEMHWPTGCKVGTVLVSNGKQWDCTNLVAKCPVTAGGPDGFTLPECDFIMNVFNEEARTKIFDCYLAKPGATDPTTCKADFDDCVNNPDQ